MICLPEWPSSLNPVPGTGVDQEVWSKELQLSSISSPLPWHHQKSGQDLQPILWTTRLPCRHRLWSLPTWLSEATGEAALKYYVFSRWAGFFYAFYLHNWCIINILQRSTITQDEMPPDYLLERRNASKVLMAVEEKYLRQLRRVEDFAWTTSIACFFLRVSTGMAGWGLVVHWDCLWQEPSWAEALFGVYISQGNKGDSLKLEMCYKATYHLHHCLCWLGFQFSRLGS